MSGRTALPSAFFDQKGEKQRMLTVEKLRAYGAQVDAGLDRCMKNEAFYLRLVQMELNDPNFAALEAALSAGDQKAAFEAAHALKGAVGNLALTPIFEPVNEITELLRSANAADTGNLLPRIQKAYQELKALAD